MLGCRCRLAEQWPALVASSRDATVTVPALFRLGQEIWIGLGSCALAWDWTNTEATMMLSMSWSAAVVSLAAVPVSPPCRRRLFLLRCRLCRRASLRRE